MEINLLDQYELDEYDELQSEELKERFRIENLAQANWALRKLTSINKKQIEIDELAVNEIQRIKDWQTKEKAKEVRTAEFFEFLLKEFLMECRKTDTKFKISTPYGSVNTNKVQTKWDIFDKEKLIEWLKLTKNDNLIKITEEAKLGEIKKFFSISGVNAVDENGEIVTGILIKEQEDKIVIKIN